VLIPRGTGNSLRAARFIVAFLRRALRPAEKFFVARVKEHDVFKRERERERERVRDQNPPHKTRIIIFVERTSGLLITVLL